MSVSNDTRAEFASIAVTMYAFKKEGHNNYDNRADMAGDLLTDLLHLVRREGGDPDAKLRMARVNFEAEEAGEQTIQELRL